MTTNYTVKSTGEQQEFCTGSRRGVSTGKPRYDLISIHGLKRLAEHLSKGAAIYGERNWELGQPVSRFYESALRHLFQWREGENTEDHLAAVLFNIMGIIHIQTEVELGNLPAELDDVTFTPVFMEQYKKFLKAIKNELFAANLTYDELKAKLAGYFNSESYFDRALSLALLSGNVCFDSGCYTLGL